MKTFEVTYTTLYPNALEDGGAERIDAQTPIEAVRDVVDGLVQNDTTYQDEGVEPISFTVDAQGGVHFDLAHSWVEQSGSHTCILEDGSAFEARQFERFQVRDITDEQVQNAVALLSGLGYTVLAPA